MPSLDLHQGTPPSSSLPPSTQASSSLQAVALVSALAYLSFGALDWFLLIDFLVDTARHLVPSGSSQPLSLPLPHTSVVASWLQEGFGMGTSPISTTPTSIASTITNTITSITSGGDVVMQQTSFSDSDRVFELSAATLYSLAYVQVRW